MNFTQELFNIKELSASWEDGFYESAWRPDTLRLTEFEKNTIKSLTDNLLPRHMPIYDWNLPYAETIILILRREFAKMVERPKPEMKDVA